jgi:5-methylcytosine-specific restriction endonuclease McrA
MKISILGAAKLVDGKIAVSHVIGQGSRVREYAREFSPDNTPSGGWDSVLDSTEPYRITRGPHYAGTTGKGSAYWLCRRMVVLVSDVRYLTEEEQKLEIANSVLRHEKRYRQLRRQLEAFDRLERADVARRERIPDAVRLFVWQRDEGKCVKCGSAEQLEYDHIIPISRGGSSTERNVQLLCEACNREKSANI